MQNKTLTILIIVILVMILACIMASQITLEKIDDDLKHYDQIIEEAER